MELGKRIEELERPEAKRRQQATQPKKGQKVGEQGGGKLPPPEGAGKTRDKVAEAVGVSGRTYEKAKAACPCPTGAPV